MVLSDNEAVLCACHVKYPVFIVFFLLVQLGIDTVPVLIGPVTYLLLSKPAKGVVKAFSVLSLLGNVLPVYK